MTPQPPQPETAHSDQALWFLDEVHPHGPVLRSYLRRSFPAVRDVDDIVQESYLRVWRARAAAPIRSAKALLFRVARNVAIDRIRRTRSSGIIPAGDFTKLSVFDETLGAFESVACQERLSIVAEAIGRLPPRSRQVLILCHLEGLSHREAAAKLGIAEKTVDELVYRSLKRLGERLRRQGFSSACEP